MDNEVVYGIRVKESGNFLYEPSLHLLADGPLRQFKFHPDCGAVEDAFRRLTHDSGDGRSYDPDHLEIVRMIIVT